MENLLFLGVPILKHFTVCHYELQVVLVRQYGMKLAVSGFIMFVNRLGSSKEYFLILYVFAFAIVGQKP